MCKVHGRHGLEGVLCGAKACALLAGVALLSKDATIHKLFSRLVIVFITIFGICIAEKHQ